MEEGIDWAGANAKNLYPEKGSPLYNQVVGYLCAGISLDNKTIQVEEVKQSYIEGDEGNSNFCLEEAQDSPGAQGQCHLTCKNSEGEWVSGDACEREGSSRHQYSFVVVHPPQDYDTRVSGIGACYFRGDNPSRKCQEKLTTYINAGLMPNDIEGGCERVENQGATKTEENPNGRGSVFCLSYKAKQKAGNPIAVGLGNTEFLSEDDCQRYMKLRYSNYESVQSGTHDLCSSEVLKGGPAWGKIVSNRGYDESHPCATNHNSQKCKDFTVTIYIANDSGMIGLTDQEVDVERNRGTGYECGTVTYTYGSELAQDKTESLIECQIKRELYLSESDTRDTRPQCGVECREGSAPGCEPPRTNDQAQICFNANRLRRDTNPSAVLANDRALRDRKRERARRADEIRYQKQRDQQKKSDSLVPCVDGCKWEDLIQLANNIISFAIRLAAFVLVLVILIAGWGLITSRGNPQALTDARAKLFKAILGFAIVVCAWLIVNTVMNTLLDEKFQNDDIINLLEDGTSWTDQGGRAEEIEGKSGEQIRQMMLDKDVEDLYQPTFNEEPVPVATPISAEEINTEENEEEPFPLSEEWLEELVKRQEERNKDAWRKIWIEELGGRPEEIEGVPIEELKEMIKDKEVELLDPNYQQTSNEEPVPVATPISAEEINTEENEEEPFPLSEEWLEELVKRQEERNKDAWRKIWIEELGGRPEEIEGVPIEELKEMIKDKEVELLDPNYQQTSNEEPVPVATPISAEEINTEENEEEPFPLSEEWLEELVKRQEERNKDAWRKIWIEELGGRPEEIEGVPIEELKEMIKDKEVELLDPNYQQTFNEELGASASGNTN